MISVLISPGLLCLVFFFLFLPAKHILYSNSKYICASYTSQSHPQTTVDFVKQNKYFEYI